MFDTLPSTNLTPPPERALRSHVPIALLPATAGLTPAERGALEGLALAVDNLANHLRHAINTDSVGQALDAASHIGHVGDVARRIAARLGTAQPTLQPEE